MLGSTTITQGVVLAHQRCCSRGLRGARCLVCATGAPGLPLLCLRLVRGDSGGGEPLLGSTTITQGLEEVLVELLALESQVAGEYQDPSDHQ